MVQTDAQIQRREGNVGRGVQEHGWGPGLVRGSPTAPLKRWHFKGKLKGEQA